LLILSVFGLAGAVTFWFPVVNRAADVPGHQALGVGGAALVDGREDLAVLGLFVRGWCGLVPGRKEES
jgi:hypothetical protein